MVHEKESYRRILGLGGGAAENRLDVLMQVCIRDIQDCSHQESQDRPDLEVDDLFQAKGLRLYFPAGQPFPHPDVGCKKPENRNEKQPEQMIVDEKNGGNGITGPVPGRVLCDGTVKKIEGKGGEQDICGIHAGVLGVLDQEWRECGEGGGQKAGPPAQKLFSQIINGWDDQNACQKRR